MNRKVIPLVALPILTMAYAPMAMAGGCSYSQSSAVQTKQDLVATAKSSGSFNTLIAALEAANLSEALQKDGPFTVFAPTDEAFAKLPEGTLSELLKPENKDKLKAILTYHVVPGKVMASDVVNMQLAKTVNGKSLTINAGSNGVNIDNAKVSKTDIETSNGVIHVIDKVILP